MDRTIKYTFSMDREQLDWLRAEHERTGAPVSEIIRRAIEAYRKERESDVQPDPA